ncbi:MAG: hypothetical protein ACOX48_03285 [Limnochordia bacterium]
MNGVSLTVRRGEILASRAWKGTAKQNSWNALQGLIHPESGQVFLGRTRISQTGRRSALSRLDWDTF